MSELNLHKVCSLINCELYGFDLGLPENTSDSVKDFLIEGAARFALKTCEKEATASLLGGEGGKKRIYVRIGNLTACFNLDDLVSLDAGAEAFTTDTDIVDWSE